MLDPAPLPLVLRRREFLSLAALPAIAAVSRGTAQAAEPAEKPKAARFFFTSQGKTAIVRADGTDLRYFDFRVPGQATWQPGPTFADGRRVVVLSMEPRRDGPGRPFGEYYTQTPTHIWVYDLEADSLKEICDKDRLARQGLSGHRAGIALLLYRKESVKVIRGA